MRIACLPGTPRLGNGKKPRRLSKFTGTSDGFKLFVSTTEKEEFTNDGSSQTSLHIMQHANLEEAPLLRPKTPISMCMWVMAFQLLRDLLVSNQTHTSSTGESRRLISSGLGEEGHTMAEEISSSVPRRMYKRPVSIQDSQNATHAEEVSLRKGWAIIVPNNNGFVKEGNGLITVEKLNAPVLPPATNRPADSNMHHFCLTTYILSTIQFDYFHRSIQEAFDEFIRKPSTEPKLGYFNYCVGYLREGILYYGDTALGGQSMFSSEKRANQVCKISEKSYIGASLMVCQQIQNVVDAVDMAERSPKGKHIQELAVKGNAVEEDMYTREM
ncbi:hypothetical protein GGP41_003884 [Bipolaris sorokiniana]|uniref:Uncharacterized protein n=1 Tax=Cochliobolus sativus TaxID=45130 RepID=A0A8H6DSR9_COCSA|nr:hypothetical protein GGP41_003884 [Bipolaris sorokiniana]